MIIYILLILLLILFSIMTINKESNMLFYVSVLILFLVLGLRGETVGTDTSYYLKFFDKPWNGYHGDRVEVGYEMFQLLIKNIWDNKYFFLTMNALVSVISLSFFVNKSSPYRIFSLLLFVLINQYYFVYFSAMRQSMAIGFFLISLYFLYRKEKSILYFILFYILSFLFHTTVIWTLPFILLIKKINFTKPSLYVFLTVSFLIGLFKVLDYFSYFSLIFNSLSLSSSMSDRYDGYALGEKFNDYDTSTVRLFKDFFLIYIIGMVATYFCDNLKSPYFKLYIIGLIVSQLIMPYPMGSRLVIYLLILQVVVVPKIFKNNSFRYGFYSFIILLFFYKAFLVLQGQYIERSKGNIYVPYESYID